MIHSIPVLAPVTALLVAPGPLTLLSPFPISGCDRFPNSEGLSRWLWWKTLSQKGPWESGRGEIVVLSPSPHFTFINGLKWYSHICSFSNALSILYSFETPTGVCGWELRQKGFAFLLVGPLLFSMGQIDSAGLSYSWVKEIILGICYPSHKYFMSLSPFPITATSTTLHSSTFSLNSFRHNSCPLQLIETACWNVTFQLFF